VGEQAGENSKYCIVGARRSEKLSGFPAPVARRIPNFTPIMAAFLSLRPAAEPIFSGQGRGCLGFYFEDTKDGLVKVFKGTIRQFLKKLSVPL
jgi:hypothetical protein